MTTRIALDPIELRGAARLLQATSIQLRTKARSFERETAALGGVTSALYGYVGDSLHGLSVRTAAVADALEKDGLVLSAIASFIEGAEASGREISITYELVAGAYQAVELIGKHAEELGVHPAVVARLIPAGATTWDEVIEQLDLPALGRFAGAAGWVIDGYQYFYESNGDWGETLIRTGITGAGGAAGGALGTAGCGLLTIEGGVPGFICFAVGALGGTAVGDWLGEKLYEPATLDDVLELADSVSRLPEPAQAEVTKLLETGEYDVYEALRTVEMNFGMLDDPQIDDDPVAP